MKRALTYNNDTLNHPFTFGYFVTCITCTSILTKILSFIFAVIEFAFFHLSMAKAVMNQKFLF